MDSYQIEIYSNAVLYVDKDGKVFGEVTFPAVDKSTVDINHTFVDESLRGQGVAGKLLNQVVQELEETGRQARATCSYAASWFREHPEKAGLLVA